MKQVNIYEAKTNLSSLVSRAALGEEVIIARNGKPLARLVPLGEDQGRRVFGQWRDEVWVYADGRIHPPGEPVVIPDLTEEELAEWNDAPILTQGDDELFGRKRSDAV